MGVPKLWEKLSPAVERVSVKALVTDPRWRSHPPPIDNSLAGLRLAVDVSRWVLHIRNGRGGSNVLLRIFYCLTRLLLMGVHPIFVFDGPHRPTTSVFQSIENFIIRFGFSVWHARGEAGAECAALVMGEHAHAVMTDDVDAFLFGAPRIVRNWSAAKEQPVASTSNETDGLDNAFIEVYDLARIKEIVGIDRDGMILVALMRGNDYSPEGVRGVGIKAAVALAKQGWGKQIVDGVKDGTLDRQAIQRGIEHELSTIASGSLTKPIPLVKLNTNFPDEEIVRSYVLPVTKIGEMEQAGEPAPVFKEGLRPDVSGLAVLCAQKFGWSTQTMVRRFVKMLFPAVAFFDMRQARWSNIVNDPLASLETPRTPISKPTPISAKSTSTKRLRSVRTPTTGPSPQKPITDYFKSTTPARLVSTPIAAQPATLILAVHARRTQYSVRELYIEWAGRAVDTFVAEARALFDEGSDLVVAAGMPSSLATQSNVKESTPVLRESRAANAVVRKQWVEEELVRKYVPELVIAFEEAETTKMQRRESGEGREGGKNGKRKRKEKKNRVVADGLTTRRIDDMFTKSKVVREKNNKDREEKEEENCDVGETAIKMNLDDEWDDAMDDARIDQMDDPIAMKIEEATKPKIKAETTSKEKQTDSDGSSSDALESVRTDVRLRRSVTPMRDHCNNEQARSQPVRGNRNDEQTRSPRSGTPVRDDLNNARVRSQRDTPVRDDRNNPFLANSDEHVGHGGGLFGEETGRQEMDATESWTGARKRGSKAQRYSRD